MQTHQIVNTLHHIIHTLSHNFIYLLTSIPTIHSYIHTPIKTYLHAALRVHFSNTRIRQLSVPYMLSMLSLGLGYIFIIYMVYRYDSSSTAVGIYIAFFGLVNAVVQGLFVPRILPNIWHEETATLLGLGLTALQTLCYGLCPVEWGLYIIVVVFCLGTIYDPALKGLIVQESRVRVTRESGSRRSYHFLVGEEGGNNDSNEEV